MFLKWTKFRTVSPNHRCPLLAQKEREGRAMLSKKDGVEISTHLDVYKYFYTKCVAILHSSVEI